jgi:uncharacterized protein YbjT (DUF2867 family)
MSARQPIPVTGAAGQVGGIGGLVVSILLERQVPVRAFVRRDDDRADALRRAGAESLWVILHGPKTLHARWTPAGVSISG